MPKKAGQLARRLGRRIAQLRAEKGLTQEGLAWDADFGSKGYLSRIESGERLPSLEVLERLSEKLGVEVRDLFIWSARSPLDAAMERLRLEAGGRAAADTRRSRGRPGKGSDPGEGHSR